jgi:hypothetical protein
MNDTEVPVSAPTARQDEIERVIRASSRVIGCAAPDVEPGVEVADWLNITRFVEVSSDDNPLYTDVRHGAASPHHTMLAPPTFVLAVRSPGSTGVYDLLPNDLTSTLTWLQVTWDDNIRLGDALRGQVTVGDVTPRLGVDGVVGACVASTAEYTRGGLGFARAQAEVELRARHSDLSATEPRPIHRYQPDEIESIAHELDVESGPRGALPRFWSQVQTGDSLPTVLRGPLTLSDLEAWVIAEGRPVRAGNLQHRWLAGRDGRRTTHPLTGWPAWDRSEASLDSAVTEPGGPQAPGELMFTLVGQLVTSWMGDDAFLRRLSVRIAGGFMYGDVLRLGGRVVDRYRMTGEDGSRYHAAAVRIVGTNQLREEILTAYAVVFLADVGKPVRLPVRGVPACDEPVGD